MWLCIGIERLVSQSPMNLWSLPICAQWDMVYLPTWMASIYVKCSKYSIWSIWLKMLQMSAHFSDVFQNDLKHLQCRVKKAYHRVDHLPIPNSGPPCLINGCEGRLSFATRGHIPYAAPSTTHQMGIHWVHQSSGKTYLNRRHIHLWLVNRPPANVPPSEIRPYDQGLWKQLVSLSKPLIRPYFWGGTLGGRFTSHEVYI